MTEMITEYSGRAIQETYTILVVIVGVLLSGHFTMGLQQWYYCTIRNALKRLFLKNILWLADTRY